MRPIAEIERDLQSAQRQLEQYRLNFQLREHARQIDVCEGYWHELQAAKKAAGR